MKSNHLSKINQIVQNQSNQIIQNQSNYPKSIKLKINQIELSRFDQIKLFMTNRMKPLKTDPIKIFRNPIELLKINQLNRNRIRSAYFIALPKIAFNNNDLIHSRPISLLPRLTIK